MSESVYSSSWYRVASLRPRLRSHVRIHRHHYRGDVWFVLQDQVSGRFHRFSPLANFLIGLFDGKRTVDDIWTICFERHGDSAPTQDEVISLLTQLHAADVLLSGAPPDVEELNTRGEKRRRQESAARWRSPLSVKVPLFDPERWLGKRRLLAELLFNRWTAILWIAAIVYTTVQVAINWPALTENVTEKVLSAENLVLIALIFPFAKAFHELGHALAVRRWGGEVHEVGVMFLVFIPIPYVDASQSSAFRHKYQRAVVGAAGMMFELMLASLAMLVWLNVEPGALRTIAYNTMLIAGVSTLFFNGNPLLRFDGYYIFMDWLEIPNLASRANEYFAYLTRRHLLRMKDAEAPEMARGEARWLLFYAIASFAYRMFIMVVILGMVASQYFILGVLLARWAAWSTLLQPILKRLHFLFTDPALAGRRGVAVAASAFLVGAITLLILAVPVPMRTVAQGVVWTPEESWVRAATNGFVTDVAAVPGQVVEKGQALVHSEDVLLSARVAMLRAEVAEISTRHAAAVTVDQVAANTIGEELKFAEERLAEAERRVRDLTLTSPVTGVFLLRESPADLPGRFLERGSPVAFVVDDSVTTVRVVVPQKDVDLVRHRLLSVDVLLSDALDIVHKASVRREVPAATDELPSMALSTAGGGAIATDPGADGRRAFQTLFQFDLELDSENRIGRLGQRVYVRFDHGWEPIGYRWYRSVRRLLLSKFNV